MTAKDKTRQKLLDSMRKTKAAVSSKPAPAAEATQSNDTAKLMSAKKVKPESTVAARSSNRTQRKTNHQTHDPFQSRGRVWPD